MMSSHSEGPLFYIGQGLSYTTFNVSALVAPSNVTIPERASASASEAARRVGSTPSAALLFAGMAGGGSPLPKVGNAAFNVSFNVSNTGTLPGTVTIFATYRKQTDGVVRWARMLCGFAKLRLAAGTAETHSMEIKVSDLARWDPDLLSATNLLGEPARGGYVVDGGQTDIHLDQCIDTGVNYGEKERACAPLTVSVTIGIDGNTYLVL